MKRTFAFAFALAFAAGAGAAGPNMRPGLWETTLQVEMPGMPVAMPPIKTQHCYTEADVSRGEDTVPKGSAAEGHCKVMDYTMRGSTATWAIQCDNMQGKGSMTYSGDSYSGVMEYDMKHEGMSQHMKQTISAHRVGDCPR